MKHAQFSVDYPSRPVHPLQHEMIRDSPVDRAELLMWSPTAGATTLFWLDGNRDAADTLVSSVGSLVRAYFVEGAEGTYGFLHQRDYEFVDPLLGVIADSRVILLPPAMFHTTGSIRFEAVGEASTLSMSYDDIAALGDLTVERVQPFDRRRSPSQLTDQQRVALEATVSIGYYKIPREGPVTDVANALDCSTSTTNELLWKAKATVLQEFIGSRWHAPTLTAPLDGCRRPPVASRVRRRPGEPPRRRQPNGRHRAHGYRGSSDRRNSGR